MSMPILSTLVLLPLAGGVGILFTGKNRPALTRQLALIISLATFAVSILMWAQFDSASAEYQMVERHSWLPDFGISCRSICSCSTCSGTRC